MGNSSYGDTLASWIAMAPMTFATEMQWSAKSVVFILAVLAFSSFMLVRALAGGTRSGEASLNLPPGPKPLPIIGNLHQLRRRGTTPLHHTLSHLATEYGPIMFLRMGGKPWVVASSAEAADAFLRGQDLDWAGRPHSMFLRLLTNNLSNITRAPYGSHWRHMRRICSLQLFTQKRLEGFRPRRTEEIDQMVRTMHEDAGTATGVTLSERIIHLTANNITRMLLNKRFFGINKEGQMEANKFKQTLAATVKTASTQTVGDLFPSLKWVTYASGYTAHAKKLKGRWDKYLQSVLDMKKLNTNTRSTKLSDADFVDVLLEQPSENGSGHLEDDCIRAVIQDMYIAGTDSTATAVEWTMTELIRHPHCMEKLQGELDTVVGKDRVISETDLPNLPYLQAVMKESLRLHPPAPLGLPHLSREPTTVLGYDLPANTQLFLNIHAIQRDPKYWPNPLDFNPERFIENLAIDVKGNHFQFIPFGAGRRQCPGMSLAILMIQISVARLTQGFHFMLPTSEDPRNLDITEAPGITSARAYPLSVIVNPRLSSNLY